MRVTTALAPQPPRRGTHPWRSSFSPQNFRAKFGLYTQLPKLPSRHPSPYRAKERKEEVGDSLSTSLSLSLLILSWTGAYFTN